MELRAVNNLPDVVEMKIDFTKIGYQFYASNNDGSWSPLGPKKSEITKQSWYKPYKFIDPNEINEKMGYPPSYIVLDRKESLIDWIQANYNVKKLIKESSRDIIFDGEFKKK